jgi:hypothetical protein
MRALLSRCLSAKYVLSALTFLLLPAISGSAQTITAERDLAAPAQKPSFTVAGDLSFVKPIGEFGQNVKQGFGLSAFGLVAKPKNPLALRLDVSYITHGSKTQRSYWGIFEFDRTTSNNIVAVGIGPQLMVTGGSIRPYINVQGGFSHYFTQTSVSDFFPDVFETESDEWRRSSRTESSDWQWSYGGGAGVMIPISSKTALVSINLGAQYYASGRTTYLTEEDIHLDENTGRITFTPRTTDARYISYRLGITVSF